MTEQASIQMQIRKVIFEQYNDPDKRFTNDEIFAVLQKDGVVEKSLTIDDMEQHFSTLCDAGLMRSIAQNFTTQWFKLFEPIEDVRCTLCGNENLLARSEERTCLYCKGVI